MQFLRAPSQRTSWSRSRPPRQALGRQPGYKRFSCDVELDGKRSWGRCTPSHNRGGTNNLEYHTELQILARILPPSARGTLKETRP